MGPLFEFRDVSLRKQATTVLDHVTVDLPGEGITVVIGASGAGKSSLLRCCNRLEVPTDGVVAFRGVDVATMPPLEHRRRVAMVFQAPTPFPGTVLANLRAVETELSRDVATALLERVGLAPALLDRSADALSGGEAQRMVVARALTTSPEVLLADEATSALDAGATTRLEGLARSLADDGMPVIWVTHDLLQVQRLADHLVVMRLGRVLWCGDAASTDAADAIDLALHGSER
ncbi:MAG TPA: ATP-binding cassette domain-containing protein [Aquihabitans sp.]|nr:ATP-binding cassette domain-containing protein [Aquihabitans sp.]